MLKTAIIIDDDEDDLDILQDILENGRIPVACYKFKYPEAAFDFLRAQTKPVDFVFTDFNMPKIRGCEVVENIRRFVCCEDTIIVVLSTSTPDDMTRELLDLGANFVFRKAVNFEDYVSMVEHVLMVKDRWMP